MRVSSAHRCAGAAVFMLALCAGPAAWGQSGDAAQTVQQLTRTIKSDSLSSGDIAQALYRRGLAYRELGQHANAIADFSSALWLGGLSAQDEGRAREQRSAAYQALGMSPQADEAGRGPPGQSSGSRAAAPAPERPAAGAFETRVESGQSAAPPQPRRQAAFNPFDSPHFDSAPSAAVPARTAARPAATPAEPEAPVRAAPQPVPAFRTAVVPEERPRRSEAPPERRAPSQRPPAAPVQPAQENGEAWTATAEPSQPRGGSRIGRFFGSFLSSGDEQDRQRTVRAAPPAESWGASTSVRRPSDGRAAQAPATTASVSMPAAADGRSYRLQLASVRSEDEARAAWDRLASRHQDLIGGREPMIERSDLGDLGTFYRVQLGPFPDRKEPLQLCNAFKRGGVDCFLIAQ